MENAFAPHAVLLFYGVLRMFYVKELFIQQIFLFKTANSIQLNN